MDRQISCMLVTLDILPRMRACSVLCRLRNGMVGHVNVSYFSHSRELVTVRGWIVRACLAKRNSALFSNSAIHVSSRYLEKERVRRPTQSWTREQKKKKTKQRWTVGDQSTTGRFFLSEVGSTFELAIGRKPFALTW